MSEVSDRDWVGLYGAPLPFAEAVSWATLPSCGALVTFLGTVRDHADGRANVERLTYEAYEEVATARMKNVASEMRRRWPVIGRLALLHRTGELIVGDIAVAIVVSTPHRPEAFAATQYGIDALKASVPIWKQEHWAGGVDWGVGAETLRDAADVS
ncbi:MAG TPA: molybdenum cofactor biosynthesis protein MoaE [Acidimicrobiales bacterium]|nr:molybdenum cofactor biosynthesis protein MoaE [Acidimicrobiales bacterium]